MAFYLFRCATFPISANQRGTRRPSRPISRVLYPGECRSDDHLSRMAVTRHLERPTRKSAGASNSRPARRNPFCLALLPVGDTWPVVSPRPPVRSYRTVSPSPANAGNLPLCCPIPPDRSAWQLTSTVLYGARTFLSYLGNCDRLANSNAVPSIAERYSTVKSLCRRLTAQVSARHPVQSSKMKSDRGTPRPAPGTSRCRCA